MRRGSATSRQRVRLAVLIAGFCGAVAAVAEPRGSRVGFVSLDGENNVVSRRRGEVTPNPSLSSVTNNVSRAVHAPHWMQR